QRSGARGAAERRPASCRGGWRAPDAGLSPRRGLAATTPPPFATRLAGLSFHLGPVRRASARQLDSWPRGRTSPPDSAERTFRVRSVPEPDSLGRVRAVSGRQPTSHSPRGPSTRGPGALLTLREGRLP